MEDLTYDLDTLPEDAEIFVGQTKEYDPVDPSETYTVQIVKAQLRDNPWHKPDAPDPKDRGSKYQFSFEFVILDEGEFYGRRLWDNTSPAFKPAGARQATKLYKIVSNALKREFDLQECFEYAPDMKTFVKNLEDEVVGTQLKVAIENSTNVNTGKIRTKVSTYNPVKTELEPYSADKARKLQMESDNESIKEDKEDKDDTDEVFDSMFADEAPEKEEKKEKKVEEKEDVEETDEDDEIPF